ncbi:site-specific DNA-methyltransferase [Methanococcus maripaludis]|uniref:Type III restriction-modification system methyltransferase n=1 Tax=Methanococcus maripaludis OS7 TaxID=637915 RepID=A0A2Z5PJW5_METMI|nr:site-specific DNA-methyltransferase [Methanococcus maripaludis]BAP62908.1 type III restriction-modification system methyltransferase [Methanococcus maripaludis OS7]
MIEETNKESINLKENLIDILKEDIPEVFSDGKIDFERLKVVLGDEITDKGENYSFNWLGRKESEKNIQTTAKGTLVPCREESVNFDKTENVFIEGDNLEVLKLLHKSYFNKIKVIYIDPPYNTGKDFIYKDNFKDGIRAYLEQTGQINEDGFKLTTNMETSGRFHSDWLSMMYPRLYVARNLLKDDGVIFVSIDDNEVHNLRMIMNEIFGEENFVGTITWEKRTKSQNTETARDLFQSKTEYILVYKKGAGKLRFNLKVSGKKVYDLKDDFGPYRLKLLDEMSSLGMRGRKTMIYPIKGIWPKKDKQWKVGQDQVKYFEDRGDIEILDNKPYFKIRPDDETDKKYSPFWSHFFSKEIYGTAETGKAELSAILGTKAHGFETVKPVNLIKKLIFHALKKSEIFNGEIILDFFAGSGTTAESIIQLNVDEKMNNKFILIQLPEPTAPNSETFKAGFKNIAELTKERIKKSIININSNEGFKVFKLARSNYRIWEKYNGNNESELKQQLKLFKDPLISNYNNEDVIFECIIKEGYSLNSKITLLDIRTNEVYKVIDEDKTRDKDSYFYICLDQKINNETIVKINPKKEDIVICLDTALDDSLKKNISIQCNLKVI